MSTQTESTKRTRIQKPGEVVFACLLMGVSLLVTYKAVGISGFSSMSSPGSVPMLASLFMLVSSLITVIKAFRVSTFNKEVSSKELSNKEPSSQHSRENTFLGNLTPPILMFFATISLIYILIIDQLGFLIASGLFLFTSIVVLYRQGFLMAILVSVNTLAIVYIIFRLIFKVILPEANLWE